MNTPLHDFIEDYVRGGFERCHTPGHKGSLNPRDITEIDGADIESVIKESEAGAAKLFGAARSLYSCSGSTLAVFAMLSCFANKRVAAARSSHRSFIDAAILLGIETDWVYEDECINDKITPETAAVFITGVDYYGKITPVPKTNLPVLVDNAHGAYLAFTDSHPIRNGAAMSADSAHKTLPALTGAAYLHFADDAYYEAAKAATSLFGTSSPSFLILESLDLCNLHLSEQKKRAQNAFNAVSELKQSLTEAGYALAESDLLRATIDANAYGYTGAALSRELIKRGVMPETHDDGRVVLLFSTITERINTERVYSALCDIPQKKAVFSEKKPLIKPRTAMPPREAYFAPSETVRLSEAAGRICAEVRVITPPGIPLFMPGEIIPENNGDGFIKVVL